MTTKLLIHPTHARNRALAVQAMLESLPPIHTEKEAHAMADALAGFAHYARACWAERCGCPDATSDDTWDLLVEAARRRKPVSIDEVIAVQAQCASQGLSS